MKKFLLLIVLFNSLLAFAEINPVKGIKPSGTLPILYINTENGQPIDQKETYIDAEWWLSANGIGEFKDVGSETDPQKLGIRGRGNSTWRHDGQKPYKLKLDKKTSLLGMGKNKHWALITRLASHELYNDLLGFELSRKMGLPFTPQTQPVEVILNGTYIGLYMLTETIRVDANRLEIFEQPDLNEDPSTIDNGWLVEIDNNIEDEQVSIPINTGGVTDCLRVTYHTPEQLSEFQREWLTNQLTNIVETSYDANIIDNTWENHIDADALIKHWIIEELMHNYDAYLGSCYLHYDESKKWKFGPVWDFSFSCFDKNRYSIADRTEQKLIFELSKKPDLKKRAKEIWLDFDKKIGMEWVNPFLTDFMLKIEKAVQQSSKVWPDNPLNAQEGLNTVLESFNFYYNFCNWYYTDWCKTWNVKYSLYLLGKDSNEAPKVTFNGLERNNFPMADDKDLELGIKCSPNNKILHIQVNGEKIEFEHASEIKMIIPNITSDTNIQIMYSSSYTNAIEDIPMDSEEIQYEYYDLNGIRYNNEPLSTGLYIRKSNKGTIEKIIR